MTNEVTINLNMLEMLLKDRNMNNLDSILIRGQKTLKSSNHQLCQTVINFRAEYPDSIEVQEIVLSSYFLRNQEKKINYRFRLVNPTFTRKKKVKKHKVLN